MKKYQVRIPTLKEEFENVINSIRWAKYFKEKNYSVIWPKSKQLKKLIENPEDLKNADFDQLKQEFEKSEYSIKINFYKTIVNKIKEKLIKEEEIFKWLKTLQQNWEFEIFDEYTIIPTAYGPGGSYNYENKTITILFNNERNTKKNLNTTIIHETVHLGIQESIVNKYKLTHPEKERIVDLICSKYLKELLPNYKTQKIGDRKVDDFVNLKNIKEDLPKAIGKYIKQYPRN